MKRPRDSQRSKVYRWEKALVRECGVYDAKLPDAHAIDALVAKMAAHCGIRKPRVIVHRGSGRAWANGGEIKFNGFPDTWLVVHEFTHTLMSHLQWRDDRYVDIQSHGPEYVSAYIYLLERFVGIPANVARLAAEKYGVKWHKVSYLPRAAA